MKICSICGKKYNEYGNNAMPINDGQCCDKCNYTVVIPRRMEIVFKNKNATKKEQKGW